MYYKGHEFLLINGFIPAFIQDIGSKYPQDTRHHYGQSKQVPRNIGAYVDHDSQCGEGKQKENYLTDIIGCVFVLIRRFQGLYFKSDLRLPLYSPLILP